MQNKLTKLFTIAAISVLAPAQSFACACGASLLDVGTSSLLPTKKGGLVFVEYSDIQQDKNWRNKDSSGAKNNNDRKISTQIITLGGQYMFNQKWGLMARVPYVERSVSSNFEEQRHGAHHHHGDDEDPAISSVKNNSIGDIKLMGIYSGFSSDLSSGLIFGLKLATGATKQTSFNRDMQIGTGSTDSILGFYHRGKIATKVGWFSQGMWQQAFETRNDYRPGNETNFSLGSYYNLGQVQESVFLSPMLQIIASKKSRDRGLNAHPTHSGYSRVLVALGAEAKIEKFKIYADIELPVFNDTNGNQLAVTRIFKLILAYQF